MKASNRDKVQEDVRFKILQALEEQPGISQRELAKALNVSLGRTNYCIKALVGKGLIKLSNFTESKHKQRYLYVLTPKGISERVSLTRRYLSRKMDEYEALKDEIEKLQSELNAKPQIANGASEN